MRGQSGKNTCDAKRTKDALLVFSALFLPGAVDNRAGPADRARKVALRVHVPGFLRRTNNLPTNEKNGQL